LAEFLLLCLVLKLTLVNCNDNGQFIPKGDKFFWVFRKIPQLEQVAFKADDSCGQPLKDFKPLPGTELLCNHPECAVALVNNSSIVPCI
jgi:hypothetical protein